MTALTKILRCVLVQAGVVAALLMFQPSGAHAQNNFGAIAYSPSSGAIGWAYDYSSRGAAERAARRACSRRGRGCRGAVWFRNACGALATGPNGWGSGWGVTRALAEKWARRTCSKHTSNCRVIRWVCTTR